MANLYHNNDVQHMTCLLDMDTTLYRGRFGYVIVDLIVFLSKTGRLDYKGDLEQDIIAMMKNPGDRTAFAKKLMHMYFDGVKHFNKDTIDRDIAEFWSDRLGNSTTWYEHTKPLISLMNQEHRETIVVSGSPREALTITQQELQFVQLYATHSTNGRYTSWQERATKDAKRWAVSFIRESRYFDVTKSFAFGDSESDTPLFDAVIPENAFFFFDDEPFEWEDKKARERKSKEKELMATSKGWTFVTRHTLMEKVKARLVAIERLA